MQTLYKYGVSLIAAIPILVVLTIVRLVSSARTNDILEFGFPFTFYEQGSGRAVWVHRFVGFGVVADAACLLFVVAAIAWGWNRVPKLLGGIFAFSAALCAIEAGSGAAIVISRTYRFAGYSISVTLISAAASVLLFRAARQRWSSHGSAEIDF